MNGVRVDRVDVSDWALIRVETRGQSEKYWLQTPDADAPERSWLFKPATVHTGGDRQVGDWSEWAVSKLASQLGLAAASIELAVKDGTLGCISQHVRPDTSWSMFSGRIWLDARKDISYSSAAARLSRRRSGASPGHSLQNIRNGLEGVSAPPYYQGLNLTAWDVFVGYLVLDALVSNRDRHEENWSILQPLSGAEALAPAYDMEGSLGYQLLDAKRREIVGDESGRLLSQFAEKGTAWRFEGHQKSTLVSVARESANLCSEPGRAWIRSLVSSLPSLDLIELKRPADGMSEVARSFALRLVDLNVRRIHDVFGDY